MLLEWLNLFALPYYSSMSMTAPLVVRQGSGGAAPGPNGELSTQFTRRSPHQDYALCSTKKGKDLVVQPSGEAVNSKRKQAAEERAAGGPRLGVPPL